MSASSQCSWSTAIRSPSRTTFTPGRFSAADVSTCPIVAPWAGGRSTRACSTPPGGTMSPAYFALPVTFSLPSRRLADCPTTLNAFTAFSGVLPSTLRSIRFPSVSWP